MGKTYKDRRKCGFKARANYKGLSKGEKKKFDEYKKSNPHKPKSEDRDEELYDDID